MGKTVYRIPVLLVSLLLVLGGCDDRDRVTVGSKNFGESNVLAEMFVILAREQGLDVAGPVEYPSTQSALEALKRGDVDIYPDYNGTGLVMIGQNPMSDGDAATARVEELYEPLGLTWLPRLGFANNYGLAMRADRAQQLGIATISDLASRAGALTLGIEADFQVRPLDGLQPLTARYGMSFGSLDIVPLDERALIYDKLIDGSVDVGEVYTTDGQIADYGMVVLEDDLEFFPVYEAAPLARADALAANPDLAMAIEQLAGRIDADTMRALNSSVDVEGRPPAAVARGALAEMGLVAPAGDATEPPLVIAASPVLAESPLGTAALRAGRHAFPGREVQLAGTADPLSALPGADARLALVEADAFFDLGGQEPVLTDRYEAVGAVGQSVVHLMAPAGAPISAIVVGPPGTASHRIGAALAAGLGLEATLVPAEDATAQAYAARLAAGEADAALVVAPIGDPAVEALIRDSGLSLRGLDAWTELANLVRYPFLREVRIPAGTYPRQALPVDSLGAQVVLAAVAPETGDMIGGQGPSAVASTVSALPDTEVLALVEALPGTVLIDPALPQAAALAPPPPATPASISPAPDVSVLNLVIIAMMVWLGCSTCARSIVEEGEHAMTTSILAPVDLADPETAQIVLTAALDQAAAAGASLTVMSVVPDFVGGLDYRYAIRGETGGSVDYDVREIVEEALERLNDLVSARTPAGTTVDTIIRHGTVYEQILQVAEDMGADQIVIGAHRPQLSDYLLGPNTARVVRHAKCSVNVVRV